MNRKQERGRLRFIKDMESVEALAGGTSPGLSYKSATVTRTGMTVKFSREKSATCNPQDLEYLVLAFTDYRRLAAQARRLAEALGRAPKKRKRGGAA
jgi:hypothetical protein